MCVCICVLQHYCIILHLVIISVRSEAMLIFILLFTFHFVLLPQCNNSTFSSFSRLLCCDFHPKEHTLLLQKHSNFHSHSTFFSALTAATVSASHKQCIFLQFLIQLRTAAIESMYCCQFCKAKQTKILSNNAHLVVVVSLLLSPGCCRLQMDARIGAAAVRYQWMGKVK